MVSLDRVGSIGALIAAIAAPCCFPLFAAVGTAAGLSGLGRFEGIILYIFQGFAVLTLAGLALSCRQHRNFGPLIVGTLSCVALAYHSSSIFSSGAVQRFVRSNWGNAVELSEQEKRADGDPKIDDYVSPLRPSHEGNNADQCLPVFLRLSGV